MSRVTARCPSCQSVFFVSAAQGKVANNLVRCGRCGHLFSVLENISESLPTSEAKPNPSEAVIEAEAVIEEVFSGSEASFAAIDQPEKIGSEKDSTKKKNMTGDSVVLDDAPVSNLALSNLAARLPNDFDLESGSTKKKGLRRQLGLALAIVLIALIGLGGQFVFFRLPTLSQELAYRPWLQTFCALVPCELEAYSEHSLITVEGLQVRAHPDLEGILTVELVLINRASLEQAYPPLLLRFDDLSGEQVAARRLSVEEYLPRSLSPNGPMPVDKAVSIKLSILDPGERALSYSVAVEE